MRDKGGIWTHILKINQMKYRNKIKQEYINQNQKLGMESDENVIL